MKRLPLRIRGGPPCLYQHRRQFEWGIGEKKIWRRGKRGEGGEREIER